MSNYSSFCAMDDEKQKAAHRKLFVVILSDDLVMKLHFFKQSDNRIPLLNILSISVMTIQMRESREGTF